MANFITIQDIKDYTAISSQVDEKFLSPFIETASDIYIEPVLGVSFSDELKDLIEISGVTGITGSNHTLLTKYIRPCHLWFCTFSALHFLDKKIKNGGIVRSAAADSTNLTETEFADFQQDVKDKAFFYKDRLKKYLDDNTSLFPSYGNCSSSGNSIGIYLGPS